MKLLSLSAGVALALASGAQAQTPFWFFSAPVPRFLITNPGAGQGLENAPGTSVESVHHAKLSNNPDGIWTTCLTGENLEALYGGDGASKGVSMGIFDPYNNGYTPNTEANALNSSDDDVHLALSADGLWAVLERKDTLTNLSKGVWISNRAAVGTAFPAPTQVTGFPTSTLASNELHPYLGTVGGVWKCFYTDGSNLLMQDIDLNNAMLTGTATAVANAVQMGAQPGSPSPLIGADGDVEALWSCDIVVPRSGTLGDSDPTFHSDLRASTPGVVRVQRPDWQGWGGIAGGWCYFTHDLLDGSEVHTMHSEVSLLLGDDEVLGGTADLTTYGTNWAAAPGGSGVPMMGAILLGTGGLFGPMGGIGVDPSWGCGPFGASRLHLDGFLPLTLPTSTNTLDGMASISFPIPNIPALSGVSIPLQALLVDDGPPQKPRFTNTAWLHIN